MAILTTKPQAPVSLKLPLGKRVQITWRTPADDGIRSWLYWKLIGYENAMLCLTPRSAPDGSRFEHGYVWVPVALVESLEQASSSAGMAVTANGGQGTGSSD